jgi:hypothetical protein
MGKNWIFGGVRRNMGGEKRKNLTRFLILLGFGSTQGIRPIFSSFVGPALVMTFLSLNIHTTLNHKPISI